MVQLGALILAPHRNDIPDVSPHDWATVAEFNVLSQKKAHSTLNRVMSSAKTLHITFTAGHILNALKDMLNEGLLGCLALKNTSISTESNDASKFLLIPHKSSISTIEKQKHWVGYLVEDPSICRSLRSDLYP